jgi:hypothetical protein
MNASAIVTLKGVQVLALGGCARLAIIFVGVMMFVAPTAQARARMGLRVWRRSWTRLTFLSGQIASTWLRGLVIMHGLVTLFIGVIALSIILLVVRLGAFHILVVMSRAIVALVVSMLIARLVVIAIVSIALMIVVVVMTVLLMVVWFTATCSG